MRKPRPSSLPSPSAGEPALPPVGEGKRGVDGHIGYLLRQAAAAQRHAMDRTLAEIGLTAPQFVVLTLIAAYPGLSGADLARLALLTPQTVSLIVANLEKADLIARRDHAVHGRIRHLDPTRSGRALLEVAKRRVAVIEAAATADLTSADEAIVRRWLVSVARMGGEAPAASAP